MTIEKNQSITESVAFMIGYIHTYPSQTRYEEYSLSIYLDDMLYGIGVNSRGGALLAGAEWYARRL